MIQSTFNMFLYKNSTDLIVQIDLTSHPHAAREDTPEKEKLQKLLPGVSPCSHGGVALT